MVFQEIVDSVQALSVEEQDNLIELIQQREQQHGKKFWDGFQELTATLAREEISFDDNDFADLRDRSPGREVNL